MIQSNRLSMEEAELAVDAALATAKELGVGSVIAVVDAAGWPIVVKTPRGGYDGKGVIVASSSVDAEGWLSHVGEPGPMSEGLLLEERVDFTRELAALVARSPSGQAAAWAVVETVQTDGICTEVLAPAPGLDPTDLPGVGHPPLRSRRDRLSAGRPAVRIAPIGWVGEGREARSSHHGTSRGAALRAGRDGTAARPGRPTDRRRPGRGREARARPVSPSSAVPLPRGSDERGSPRLSGRALLRAHHLSVGTVSLAPCASLCDAPDRARSAATVTPPPHAVDSASGPPYRAGGSAGVGTIAAGNGQLP